PHDALLYAEVDQAAFAADPGAVEDVEFGHLEWRRHLVLHDLDTGPVADRVGAVLERLDPAHVQPDRGVELERLAAAGRLRAVVDHHPVYEVVMRSFHLDIEAVHGPGGRLDVNVQDPCGDHP